MGDYPKYDYAPLLAPGAHRLALPEIESLCVHRFAVQAMRHREKLYYALEDFIQRLLVARIPCTVLVDGSFLTEKPYPDDVDVFVTTDHDVIGHLTETQLQLLGNINSGTGFIGGVDSLAMTKYPHGHPHCGTALDGGNGDQAYGIEHSRQWLKGYVIVTVWETDVGNRICR
jgi:hypothetical protein